MEELDETKTGALVGWDGAEPVAPGMRGAERVRLVRPLEQGGMWAVWVAESRVTP